MSEWQDLTKRTAGKDCKNNHDKMEKYENNKDRNDKQRGRLRN